MTVKDGRMGTKSPNLSWLITTSICKQRHKQKWFCLIHKINVPSVWRCCSIGDTWILTSDHRKDKKKTIKHGRNQTKQKNPTGNGAVWPEMEVHTLEPWCHWLATVKHRDSSPRELDRHHSRRGGIVRSQPWGHEASSSWGHTEPLTTLPWWRTTSETPGGRDWSTSQQTYIG